MITIIAKFDVIPDCIEQFKKCAAAVIRESRKEKGNMTYKIYSERKDASKFIFIEEWLNDAAIEQHNVSDHFTRFVREIEPLTNGSPQIQQIIKVSSVFQ